MGCLSILWITYSFMESHKKLNTIPSRLHAMIAAAPVPDGGPTGCGPMRPCLLKHGSFAEPGGPTGWGPRKPCGMFKFSVDNALAYGITHKNLHNDIRIRNP